MDFSSRLDPKFKGISKTILENAVYISYISNLNAIILYGSETWCLRENEMAILRRTEKSMVRAMCGIKLMDRKNTKEPMSTICWVYIIRWISWQEQMGYVGMGMF